MFLLTIVTNKSNLIQTELAVRQKKINLFKFF